MTDEELIAEVLSRELLIAHEVRDGAQLWEIPRDLIPRIVGVLDVELGDALSEGNA